VVRVFLGFILYIIASATNAATIVSPVSASAVSASTGESANGVSALYIPGMYNQSQLSNSFVSGVTDFDDYLLLNPTHGGSVPYVNTMWASWGNFNRPTLSYNLIPDPIVTFDLGDVYSLSAFKWWNASYIRTMEMEVSVDGTYYQSVGGLPDYDDALGYLPMSPKNAQFIRMTLVCSPHCSIGEVAFAADPAETVVPLPASAALLLSALFGSSLVIRRKRRSLNL